MRTFGRFITRTFLPVTLMTVTLIASGCRSELFDQEYGEPLEQSNFYADKRMSRPLVEGTVPTNNWEDHRDHLRENDLMYTGLNESGKHADVFPMEVTEQVMLRGRERYNIFCSPCHGKTGQGDGMIIQRSKGGRGLKTPPAFTDARLVSSPAGYFYDVITNGFGQMYSYASRVKPADRWAIVAYIRALQKSHEGMGAGEATAAPTTATATEEATPAEGTGNDTTSNTN
ncbi:MAG: cytochrome c [Candidatus Kapaibacterium sp.]